MKRKTPNRFNVVVRGDKGFCLEIFIPFQDVDNDFTLAYQQAIKFKTKCESMTNEILRISQIKEISL